MSTRSELETLIRLAPEVSSTVVISDVNLRTLLDKATIDVALRGRALPKSELVNAVASQREYVLSGASPVLTDNDFLGIDLQGGGVQFNDGSRWIGPPEFKPATKEWLDRYYSNWRSNSATSTPLYWYLDTQEDNASNLVLGLVDKPSANGTNVLLVHYCSRGKLMTASTHYPWTGSTTQLVHLEPYEPLLVYYCLEWINRLITKDVAAADKYKTLYEAGVQAMAQRLPLHDHLVRHAFAPPPYFSRLGGGRRF